MGIRGLLRSVWAVLALGYALAVGAAPAAAVGIPLATCTLRAAPGQSAATLMAHPERFDCTTPSADLGSGDFWVRSQPLPILAGHGANVRYGTTWMDRTTLYVRYADGVVRTLRFDSATVGRQITLGAATTIALPRRDTRPVGLLWHIEGAANLRGLLLGVSLATHSEVANAEIAMAAWFGAFAGLILGLMIYNLALWGALRLRFQPVYCALMLCLLAYAVSSSGALAMVWPGLDNNDRHRINVVLLAMSASMAIAFARSFFEHAVFAGWVRRASSGVVVMLLCIASTWAAMAPIYIHLLDRLLSTAYLMLLLLVPLILWRAWRVGSNYLWLFALAWGAPIAMGAIRVANVFGLVGWSRWIDQSTILSMAIEALLSSIAIAYRIRLLSRDRDRAREDESAARLLADTDPLTGLLNRRAFLDQAIGRPGAQTLFVADIDHFKRVNDTIGHDGGDEVLRVFARILRQSVPPGSLVARIGGEEFATLTAAQHALKPTTILDRLRSERMPYDLCVTASIGSCTGPLLRETDWKTLYRSADTALFAAKAAGRDRARESGTMLDAA